MRSAEDYWGNDGRLDVREANYIVAALCWLVPFAISLGISIMVENPLGSMFFKVASMSRMLAEYAFKRVVTYHAAFGAKSMKAFEDYVHNIKDDCLRYMVRGRDQAVARMEAFVAAGGTTQPLTKTTPKRDKQSGGSPKKRSKGWSSNTWVSGSKHQKVNFAVFQVQKH